MRTIFIFTPVTGYKWELTQAVIWRERQWPFRETRFAFSWLQTDRIICMDLL